MRVFPTASSGREALGLRIDAPLGDIARHLIATIRAHPELKTIDRHGPCTKEISAILDSHIGAAQSPGHDEPVSMREGSIARGLLPLEHSRELLAAKLRISGCLIPGDICYRMPILALRENLVRPVARTR